MNLLTQKALVPVQTAIFVLLLGLIGVNTLNAQIQRVRLDFTAPDGAVRQILLGFTPNNEASDGIDFGYDAANWDNFANDLNWIIEDYRYIIQGVGQFEDTKVYPMGMYLGETGDISISLNALENFNEDIEVYIYDALLETYSLINDSDYADTIEAGEHLDRFYIAFSIPETSANNNTLSSTDFNKAGVAIKYLINSKEIFVSSNNSVSIEEIQLFSIEGKLIFSDLLNNERLYRKNYKLQSKGSYIIRVKTNRSCFSKIIII
ncbi:T9SS type A sorting domain-containing protein [Winogradskyella immobilis]|uniref:T9SS type A sorting domain-containing protein n=1 Tax=Winogradskyella immobilis TaxID=2816852 RepID=A0ABS8EQU3_9FLAO|nr:T9SS type A sorting domain-containing protein [Winogradskyella immobilis]MCC1485604.1 T9SS type A sorting domain-containing protein [Winogradskyella immobilis]MCG0017696.1 T9SS type A sorting domain-containing protein [Winogradskyella immobilis]